MIASISDIHGCYEQLKKILNQLSKFKIEKTIFLGDYIDRGTKVKETLDLILDYSKTNKSIFLQGNHENMAIDFLYKKNLYNEGVWFKNGAKETLNSLCNSYNNDYIKHIDKKYIFFLKSLENNIYYEYSNYIFVHGGIRDFKLNIEEQDLNCKKENAIKKHYSYLWVREDFLKQEKPYKNKVIIHGHTPVFYLTNYGIKPKNIYESYYKYSKDQDLISIDIDTGCVYGYSLSALLIENNNYYNISIQ
ncbi:serine/threonine protein phosphatase [Tepiditoga spiralis]|uniref:Serine/threonine protein phosphatase n=1 Tax=Tepiditoga spiralis TaxID=2108365 RepID=A0A7G1G8Z6_9BACT|nr:metallophosphoesterase family protein [Tepiditoga spiralis]BBE31447.1 serine/threonine protein phosphatase [Tepiditoga spiralis]